MLMLLRDAAMMMPPYAAFMAASHARAICCYVFMMRLRHMSTSRSALLLLPAAVCDATLDADYFVFAGRTLLRCLCEYAILLHAAMLLCRARLVAAMS